MHDSKFSYFIGCHYWHKHTGIHKSLNHPIVDLHKQVHGFPLVSFVHINPSNNRGIVDNCNVATLTLGLWPRQGLAKVWAKNEAQDSHFMLSGVWEGDKMNLHTPKWAFTLGIKVLMETQIFKEWFQGSKPNGLKISLYH